MSLKTYSELIKLETFQERYEYLRLHGFVGKETFGYDRYLNQVFYKSPEWKNLRNHIIMRDHGCDLGVSGYEINSKIIIHHMNPITEKDIYHRDENILDPEYLISVSQDTHNAIHYGTDSTILYPEPIIRTANDTCPWR